MLNANGEVVGMNSWGYSGDVAQGIFFAIKFDVLSGRFTALKSGQPSPSTPVPTPGVVATRTPGYVFGPESGSMRGSDGRWFVDSETVGTEFVVEATVSMPPSSTQNWGIVMSANSGSDFHSFIVSNFGAWFHLDSPEPTGSPQWNQSPNIKTYESAANEIQVIFAGGNAFLFINDTFERSFEISKPTSEYQIALLGLTETNTAPTYSDFSIRKLSKVYGPRNGNIRHDPDDGSIDTHASRVSMSNGVIEATFYNPYGSWQGNWSSGFLIRVRDGGDGEFHAIVIRSGGRWFHYLRTGDRINQRSLKDGFSSRISTTNAGSNLIRIIALGSNGWLFINGAFVEKLDLSGGLPSGTVYALGTWFADDGLAGYSTRFQNFTTWSVD